MALKLTGRNPAKFEFDDGIQKTEIVVQPNDEPDVVRAKLQRVLDLEGATVSPFTAPVAPPAAPEEPTFTAADRAAYDARLKAAEEPMGWSEDVNFDNLPEA